jgi:hypothetical protein
MNVLTGTAPDHPLAAAFSRFAELLDRRLTLKVATSEDAVRYTFFYALIDALNLKPEDIILEHDHTSIARAKIDTWIPNYADRAYAIEFKYDRPIPSKLNPPLTQKAGQVFRDVFRLAQAHLPDKIETIFIYLTTREMASYFSNTANGLAEFFNLRPGANLTIPSNYLDLRAATLRRAAGAVIPCTAGILLSHSLPLGHEIRAYAIHPIIT